MGHPVYYLEEACHNLYIYQKLQVLGFYQGSIQKKALFLIFGKLDQILLKTLLKFIYNFIK